MKKADRIYYGGDYNPEQWEDEVIDRDMEYFAEAGINLLTLPVFAWAKLEPAEGVYDFAWLDHIIDKIWSHRIYICLATPTTAQPAWLSTRYPEVLPVDIEGRRRTHGMRVFFCVNSLKYRERAAAIANEMAKRYAHHPALAMWHVANEYGTYCYCPACQAKFRLWLRRRYGTVEELNRRWNTAFWGRTLTDFEEVCLPTKLNDDYRFQPAIQLDYLRFVTDSTAECFLNEYRVLKKYNPEIPVQTNMSGYIKKLDQFEMTKHMDLVGWDNYPWPSDPPHFIALKHDIMRGLKGGQSFVLTEQSPNQQNWQPYNRLKRPGEVRLLSYQALAHGADTCLFFQMRQSAAGQEKFHGAVISHAGHNQTRVFREIAALGQELAKLKDSFIEGRTPARVGMLFDWNSWWALELSSGPSKDMDYLKTVSRFYKPFFDRNIPVDILNIHGDFQNYDLIVAPMLYMTKEGVAEALTGFVRQGGTLVTTVMSGLADENDRCVFGEYPGKLKDVLGIWVEETDAYRPEETNQIVVEGDLAFDRERYGCGFLCDIIHTRGAKPLGRYGSDFYAGVPCVTVNDFGKGKAYYIGTEPEEDYLSELIGHICEHCGLKPVYRTGEAASMGVELTRRINEASETIFAINHSREAKKVDFGEDRLLNLITKEEVTGTREIGGWDVLVLRRITE